jgi:hypothetical protein
MFTLTCENCKKPYQSGKNNGKWCPACRPLMKRKYGKQYRSVRHIPGQRFFYHSEPRCDAERDPVLREQMVQEQIERIGKEISR